AQQQYFQAREQALATFCENDARRQRAYQKLFALAQSIDWRPTRETRPAEQDKAPLNLASQAPEQVVGQVQRDENAPSLQRAVEGQPLRPSVPLAAEEMPLSTVEQTIPERSGAAGPNSDQIADHSGLQEQTDCVSRAIALMLTAEREGRNITVDQVAQAAGCSRATLYRNPQFRATRAALKAKRKGEHDARRSA